MKPKDLKSMWTCIKKMNKILELKFIYILSKRMPMTHHGGYHQKRQDPGWLSSRNLASTLTELPSGGYTAYLMRQIVIWWSDTYNMNTIVTKVVCVSVCTCTRRVSSVALCLVVHLWSGTRGCWWSRAAFHGNFWHCENVLIMLANQLNSWWILIYNYNLAILTNSLEVKL